MTTPRVSVVIPTMNEEASIGEVLEGIRRSLGEMGWSYEVIVVDTNSQDQTVEIAAHQNAAVIREPRRGYGRAYKTGFAAVQGELIVALDADMTYPTNSIPELLRAVEGGGYDFVSGERMSQLQGEAMRLRHRLGNRILTWTTRLLYGVRIRDSQSGMWAFRRSILPRLELKSDGMAFSEEIKLEVQRCGFRFSEVPIPYGIRRGEAKIRSWADGWGNFSFLLKRKFVRRGRVRRSLSVPQDEFPTETPK